MSIKVKKRGQKRIDLTDYVAVFVEDGCNCTGTLKEISLNGLRVNIAPIGSRLIAGSGLSWFHNPESWRNRKFRIIISERLNGKNYKVEYCLSRPKNNYMVIAHPRWRREKDTLMEIGFEISDSSAAWKVFVQEKVSELN